MSGYLPIGCTLTTLDATTCESIITSLAQGDKFSDQPDNLAWLLAHSDGGVTWGHFKNGTWKLASSVFPDIAPPLEKARLQQLRIFGPTSEHMLWRTPGGFAGRVCAQAPEPEESYLKPDTEYRPLLGDRPDQHKDGFSVISIASGRRQALPLTFPDPFKPAFLKVVHHFRQDESGAVRVALSRLAELEFS